MISAALAVIVILANGLTSCDAALNAMDKGQPIDGRVTAIAGKQAAERLPKAKDAQAVAALSRIAREGKAEQELANGLLILISRESDDRSSEAQRQLEELTDDLLVLGRQMDLVRARRALAVVVPLLEPYALGKLLGDLTETPSLRRHANCALQAAGRSRQPLTTYEFLSGLRLDPVHEYAVGGALAELASRNSKVSELALMLAEKEPTPPVLRSLCGVRPDHWDEAMSLLEVSLQLETGRILAAAVYSAAELRMPEVLPLLPKLAREGKTLSLRVAALRAIPKVAYRDAPTIDLLIELLDDPLVREESYRSLRAKTGVALPLEPYAWHAWRRGFLLQVEGPVPDAQRLDKGRALLAVLRTTAGYKPSRLPLSPARRPEVVMATTTPKAQQKPARSNAVLAGALGAMGLLLILVMMASRTKPRRQANMVELDGKKPANLDGKKPANLDGKKPANLDGKKKVVAKARSPKPSKRPKTKPAKAKSNLTMDYVEDLVGKLDVEIERTVKLETRVARPRRRVGPRRSGSRRVRVRPRPSDLRRVRGMQDRPKAAMNRPTPRCSDTRRLRAIRKDSPQAKRRRPPPRSDLGTVDSLYLTKRPRRPAPREQTDCWDVLRGTRGRS